MKLHSNSTKTSKRGQAAVEFFLILAFSLALLAILVSNAESQIAQTSLLEKTVMAQAALDSLSQSINFVYLQGNNSRTRTQILVPQGASGSGGASCFFNFSNALSCYIGDPQGRQVYTRNLLALPSQIDSDCYSSGWKEVAVSNYDNRILVDCENIA